MQAARAVTRVLEGANLRDALAEVDDGAALRGRSLVQELAYGTLRHWGTLDAIAGQLARKPIADARLRSLVAVALYQLDHTRAPAFAVVDRAVFAAGELARSAAKALVNALLRRYLRERAALHEAVSGNEVARWSHPQWWIDRVRRDYPGDWQPILEAGNARPPLTLRVNRRIADPAALLAAFAAAGIEASAQGDVGDHRRRAAPGHRVARLRRRRIRRAGSRRAAGGAAARCRRRHAGARCVRRAGRQDRAPARARRCRAGCTRRRCRSGSPAFAKTSRGCGSRIGSVARRGGRCRRAERMVGRPAVRPHPAGRSVHGVGRRPPASRRKMAAPGVRRRPLRPRSNRDCWTPHGRCWSPAGSCSMRRARCSRRKTRSGSGIFSRNHPDALRESLTFPAQASHRGGQLLPSPSGGSHNQDGFFYALLRKR